MRFEHGRLRLEIDDRTGSIASIADALSGRVHFDGRQRGGATGRLFRLLMPVERWSSHAADSWRAGAPEITASPDAIVISYADVPTPTGPSRVAAEVHVTRGGASEALITLRVSSHRRDGDVTDVLFPWLTGWMPTDPIDPAAEVVLGGVRSVAPSAFPVNRGMTFQRWHQREYYTYPIDLYAPWVDCSTGDGGVGIVSYQRSARNLGAFIENLAGYEAGVDLSVGLNHYLQLRDGQTWESPPIGISVHEGDWHATADRYSAWVDSWFKPPSTPEWARRSIGFQNVLFRSFDGSPIHPLTSIPEIAAAGVKAGVPHLCVWDYAMLGDYGKLDEVPPQAFAAGEVDVLRTALADAHRVGARLSALQNYRLVKPTSRLFAEVAHAETCRRYDGSPFVEEYCGSLHHAMVITTHVGPMVHPVDARIASVRERVLRLIDENLALGFDSIFYDQPFENWPSYHPGRGDDGPDGAHSGTVELLHDVRARLTTRQPDGIMIGEYCDVFGSEAIDLWMSWYTEFGDLSRSRYSIPQTLQSWVVDHDPVAATRAFVVGAQLCLTTSGNERHLGDVPVFAQQVTRLASLRDASVPIWSGRFVDQAGFELASDGPAIAGGFESAAGRAIVVGSPGAAGRADLSIDRGRFPSTTGGLTVRRMDGRTETLAGDSVSLVLDANEVAVIEC